MANEINGILPGGITAIARVYAPGWVQQGSDVSLTEVSSGLYTGNFDLTTLVDGIYSVVFWEGTAIVNSGTFEVENGVEVLPASSSGLVDMASDISEINSRTVFIASEVRD